MRLQLLICEPCPGHEEDARDRASIHLYVAHEKLIAPVIEDVVHGGQLVLPLGREWADDVIEVHVRPQVMPYVDRRQVDIERKLAA